MLINLIPRKLYYIVPAIASIGSGSGAGLLSTLDPKFVNNPNAVMAITSAWGCFAFALSVTVSLIMANRESVANLEYKTALIKREYSGGFDSYSSEYEEEEDSEEIAAYKERVKKEGPGFHALKPGWNSHLQQAKNMILVNSSGIPIPVTNAQPQVVNAAGYRNGKNEPPHNKVNPAVPDYVSIKQMVEMGRRFFRTQEGKKLTTKYWVEGNTRVFIRRSQFEPLIIWMEEQGLINVKNGNGEKEWTPKGMEWLGKLVDAYSPTPGTIKKR